MNSPIRNETPSKQRPSIESIERQKRNIAIPWEAGVGTNFLGVAHTMRHYKSANFRAELADATPFEQWSEAGSRDMQQRAYGRWNRMLAEYETPPIDPAIDEALLEFISRKKASMEDAWY